MVNRGIFGKDTGRRSTRRSGQTSWNHLQITFSPNILNYLWRNGKKKLATTNMHKLKLWNQYPFIRFFPFTKDKWFWLFQISKLTLDIMCESSCGYDLNVQSGSPEALDTYMSFKHVIMNQLFLLLPFLRKTPSYVTYRQHLHNIYKKIDNIISQDSRKVFIITALVIFFA